MIFLWFAELSYARQSLDAIKDLLFDRNLDMVEASVDQLDSRIDDLLQYLNRAMKNDHDVMFWLKLYLFQISSVEHTCRRLGRESLLETDSQNLWMGEWRMGRKFWESVSSKFDLLKNWVPDCSAQDRISGKSF